MRSNTGRQFGFLGKADAEQRVNVLCTRARIGLILIGNVQCLEVSSLWQRLLAMLRKSGSVFPGLPTQCVMHQEWKDPLSMATPEQIEDVISKEAGCGHRCDHVLPCGHACPLLCHPFDPEHRRVVCSRLVRSDCRAMVHRVDMPCCKLTAPRCIIPVVEACGSGHFVIGGCRESAPLCKSCKVLRTYQKKMASFAVDRSNLETRLSEHAVRVASEAMLKPFSLDQDCTTAVQSERHPVVAEMRSEARKNHKSLVAYFEEKQKQLQTDVGLKLDQQQREQEQALTGAHGRLKAGRTGHETVTSEESRNRSRAATSCPGARTTWG